MAWRCGERFRRLGALVVVCAVGLMPNVALAGGTQFPESGTRPLARGGAFFASANDPMVTFLNPANLAEMRGIQLGLNAHLAFYQLCFNRAGTYGAYPTGEDGSPIQPPNDFSFPGAIVQDLDGNGIADTNVLVNPSNPAGQPGPGSTIVSLNDANSIFTNGQTTLAAVGDSGIPVGQTAFPEVCNTPNMGLVPQLGFTWRVHERVGIGIGFFAPFGIGELEYGQQRRVAVDQSVYDRDGDGSLDTRQADFDANGDGMIATDGSETFTVPVNVPSDAVDLDGDGIPDARDVLGTVPVPGSPIGILPAPTRYNLIDQDLSVAFPTIGVGVKVTDKIRVGASFASGFALLSLRTLSRSFRGENFNDDALSNVDGAVDPFVPRVTASIAANPIDNLTVSSTFIWTDDIVAEGDLRVTSGYYNSQPYDELRIRNTEVFSPQPWQLAFAMRYADRIRPRNTGLEGGEDDPTRAFGDDRVINDAMTNENWDVELDLVWERNSLIDASAIRPGNCVQSNLDQDPRNGSYPDRDCSIPANFPQLGPLYIASLDSAGSIPGTVPNDVSVARNWQDQLSLRAGGSYNVVPGVFSLHSGFSFETKGMKDGFERIDLAPLMRFGAHAGFTLRVGRWDLTFAYAHIHQRAETITTAEAGVQQTVSDGRLRQLACAEDEFCGRLSEEGQRARAARLPLGPGASDDVRQAYENNQETTPRQNANGQFIDASGNVVSDPADAEQLEVRSTDFQTQFGEGTRVNIGKIRSNLDVVSFSITYHFR
ncbi:MAG: hypothetical protein AAGH15_07750 [Myxococcota bacterium]